MADATVADLLAFESWPRAQQEIARAALYHETEAHRADIESDVREEHQHWMDLVGMSVKKLRALTTGINEAMAEARDVTKERHVREARWATVVSGLTDWDAALKKLEALT